MNEYEGFSKQDLRDRRRSLVDEEIENVTRNVEIYSELKRIDKLLEEMK